MRYVIRSTVSLSLLSAAFVALPVSAQNPKYTNKLAPYVVSPAAVVDRMLQLARPKPGETLYDLGCGDGGILISAVQKYHVKAVGVEISPKLAATASARITKAGLDKQARVINGDLLQIDFSDADVVAIYLNTSLNEELRPHLERYLKNGARVVSHDYPVPGWRAAKTERHSGEHVHMIYLYEMPPVRE
jgi:predicted RNA methylase